MSRKDHALVAGGGLACFALAVFQLWYVALPLDRAALLDVCRWSPHLDCFETLHRDGVRLLSALAALTAVLLLQCTLAVLAATAPQPRREAWLGIARVASFATSGLAIYLLLWDLFLRGSAGPLDPVRTSPSVVLIATLSVAMNVHTVMRGGLGFRLSDAGAVPVALAAGAALFGFFAEGAAGAARESAAIQERVDAQPPAVVVPDFETEIPRQGAVALGDARAPREVLLFLDPAQEASLAVLRDALAATTEDVLLHVYLRGHALPADGRAILETVARGGAPPAAQASALPERHVARARITEWPTAIWREGRRSGAFPLADILAAARTASR
jgi:hypothetical protein